jgi:hypothetical protein
MALPLSFPFITASLPKPSLFAEPAKTAYMISISSKGICGEDDFQVSVTERRPEYSLKREGT